METAHEDQTELIKALEDTTDEDEINQVAQNLHRLAAEGLLNVFDSPTNPIDIIVAPSDSMLVSPVAAAGFTAGVVPLGYLESCGQPQGLTIAAKAGEESTLLRFMSAWEATFPKRRVPPLLR